MKSSVGSVTVPDKTPPSKVVQNSYVSADERVLDPTKLDLSMVERMPQPSGWRILVLPYRGKGQTEGGILLTDQTLVEDQLQTVVGYVVKKVH